MSSEEAASRVRITLRQLQYWDEKGIVKAVRNGHAREYSEQQVRELQVLAEFRKKGVSLQRLRRLAPQIRRHVAAADGRGAFLGLRGTKVLLLTGPHAVAEAIESASVSRPLIVAVIHA